MATSMSEQRAVGAIIILIEGLLGMTKDETLKGALETTHKALVGYMTEQDSARKEKLALIEATKTGNEDSDNGFDRVGYNKALIEKIRAMHEIELTVTHDKTTSGKSVTKIEFTVEDKALFLYDFKIWETGTGVRWLKGSEFARLLWVNSKGYLNIDGKKGQPVIAAATERVSYDIPF